jgi:hypothetical protein
VTDKSLKAALLSLAALVKLALLLRFGALPSDDSGGYLALAHAIQTDPAIWSSVPGWHRQALPLYAFRPYGYPALIALAQMLAGSQFGVLLILLQIALSLVVGSMLFDVCRQMAPHARWIAGAALGFYFSSVTLLWDQSIMSDSLFASLFNIVLLSLVAGRVRGLATITALGLAWAGAVLLREVGLYLTVIPLVLLVMLPRLGRWRRIVAFLVPVVALTGLYASWNHARTGTAFLSITGVANYLRPGFDLTIMELATPFDGDDPLSRIVQQHPDEYVFPDQLKLLQQIHDGLDLQSPFQLQALELANYRAMVGRFPVQYGRYVAAQLTPPNLGALLFDPVSSLNDYGQLGLPPYQRIIPGTGWKSVRDLWRAGDVGGLTLALVSLVTLIGATLAWSATALGVVWLAAREWRDPQIRLAVAMLATFLAVVGFYALVHSDSRLRMPAIPAGLIAASIVAGQVRTRRLV